MGRLNKQHFFHKCSVFCHSRIQNAFKLANSSFKIPEYNSQLNLTEKRCLNVFYHVKFLLLFIFLMFSLFVFISLILIVTNRGSCTVQVSSNTYDRCAIFLLYSYWCDLVTFLFKTKGTQQL